MHCFRGALVKSGSADVLSGLGLELRLTLGLGIRLGGGLISHSLIMALPVATSTDSHMRLLPVAVFLEGFDILWPGALFSKGRMTDVRRSQVDFATPVTGRFCDVAAYSQNWSLVRPSQMWSQTTPEFATYLSLLQMHDYNNLQQKESYFPSFTNMAFRLRLRRRTCDQRWRIGPLYFWHFELKIGIPFTPALGNIHISFVVELGACM